jgi:hypothetical protein
MLKYEGRVGQMNEGDALPGHGEWMTTGEVAALWTNVSGAEISAEKIRRWCHTGNPHMDGIEVWHVGGRTLIERRSLLDELRRRVTAGMLALDEEEARR